MKKSHGFTLLEIIIVLAIITTLIMAGLVVYPSLQRRARDSSRKADLENIRSALELYRSKNSYYPVSLSELTQGSLYLQSIPTDPHSPTQIYTYVPKSGCDNSILLCTDYSIGAKLEIDPAVVCSLSINCGVASCNYCLGPYGQK